MHLDTRHDSSNKRSIGLHTLSYWSDKHRL